MGNDIVEAIRELSPGIRERAKQTETDRRLPDSTMAALVDCGLFTMLQPEDSGGTQQSPVDFFAAIRTLAAACPSTGWTASLLGAAPWHVTLLGLQARADVWGEDRTALVSTSYAPNGRLVAVDGGYRLSGEWKAAPGVDHCSWCLLGCLLLGPAGSPVDYLTVLVPRSDFCLEEAWNVVGLRGSGNKDVSVRDAFVPAHRAFGAAGREKPANPRTDFEAPPMYRIPLSLIHCTAATMPIIGAAEGAYEYHLNRMRDRNKFSHGGQQQTEDGSAYLAIARGESDLDAAVLQIERDLHDHLEHANRDQPVPLPLRLRARRNQVRAAERGLEALDLLFKAAGGHAVQMDAPIQRAWRDAHTAAAHMANNAEHPLTLYGRWRHGVTVDDSMIMP